MKSEIEASKPCVWNNTERHGWDVLLRAFRVPHGPPGSTSDGNFTRGTSPHAVSLSESLFADFAAIPCSGTLDASRPKDVMVDRMAVGHQLMKWVWFERWSFPQCSGREPSRAYSAPVLSGAPH